MINYNYLVVDSISRQAVVVDPAWELGKIESAIEDCDAKLNGILLTHSHPDHVHLAESISEIHNCPVWMSQIEIAASGFNCRRITGIDETPILVGHIKVQPLLTPGHTRGSMCYKIGNSIFTGDTLFAEGCGICPDVPSANAMFQRFGSIQDILMEKSLGRYFLM